MLTSLALLVLPTLQGAGDHAALHPASADFFMDVPDVEPLVKAWMETALPLIVRDSTLKDLYKLVGMSGPEDLLNQLPLGDAVQLLEVAKNIKGLSFSLTVDEQEVIDLALTYGVYAEQEFSLDFLKQLIEGTYYRTGNLPADLSGLGLTDDFLLDTFDRPFFYEAEDDGTFILKGLGADGLPGGTGLSRDQDAGVSLLPHLFSSAANLIGGELVVEWKNPDMIEPWIGLLAGRLQGQYPFVQRSNLPVLEESPNFPPSAFRFNPADVGGPEDAEPVEVSIQSIGDATVVTFGTIKGQAIQPLLKYAAADEVHPTSLAATPNYQRAMAEVRIEDGVLVWRGFLGERSEQLADTTGGLDNFLELFGLSTKSGSWETRIQNGTYRSVSYTQGGSLPDKATLNRVAALIPNEAVFVQVGTLRPRGLWELFGGLTSESDSLGELLEKLEVDVEADLVDNLGDEFALWVNPVRGLTIPELYIVIPVQNGETVMSALDALFDQLAQVDAGISVSRRPYKGVDYSALDVGIPIGVVPTFAVLDDELWISNSSILIKREIRRRDQGKPSARGEHPVFNRLQDESGVLPADLKRAGYLDLGAIFSSYYSGGRALSGMVTMGMDLPPGFLDALPDSDLFTRHIVPTFSETRARSGGFTTTKVGAFGPEPFLIGGIGITAGIVAFSIVGQEPLGLAPPPQWTDREGAEIEVQVAGIQADEFETKVTLALVDVGLLLYSIDKGDQPKTLADLVKTSKAYPNGYLGESMVPKDGWGNTLRYEAKADGEYVLYSLGPDGVDNGGTGDDILP
ncbi:MAG: hypothetical protein ACI9C2_000706 [Gammaproteobacteria bacterium]|jgi:hypothetical protein